MRAEGETLENIGMLIGTTRERVRQVEHKFTKRFASNYLNNDYDLLAVIHAFRGGDDVLTKEEVSALIGEKIQIYYGLFSQKNCSIVRCIDIQKNIMRFFL